MKRVLVTGASGFIGRHVLERLLARGFEVHGVSRRPAEARGVTSHAVDLLAPGAVASVIDAVRPTHLLHLAWIMTPGLYWRSDENLRWLSVSLDLVRSFWSSGGERAVFGGTCAEYDWRHGWCSEDVTPLEPSTAYGVTKDALRRAVEAQARTAAHSWAWGRVFFVYGPGEHPDRLVPAAVRAMLRGEATRCTHGRQIRDFLHVADVAEAFATLVDGSLQGAVNVASGVPRALRDIVTAAAAILGTPHLTRFGDLPSPPDEPPLLVADVRRLRNELGFEPHFDLDRGLEDVIRRLHVPSQEAS